MSFFKITMTVDMLSNIVEQSLSVARIEELMLAMCFCVNRE